MLKRFSVIFLALLLVACDKHDPILPGVRSPIFDSASVRVLNQTITNVPESVHVFDNTSCKYTQDSENVIWNGKRKVFSGFSTPNSVASNQTPVCVGAYVYAGLTTGELIKIKPGTRQIMWVSDIYRASNLTGGASLVDIVAPIVPYKNYIYVGGLGDAFCKVSMTSGTKAWCLDIGVGVPFILAGDYAFVVATDNNLYAISIRDGGVIWSANIDKQVAPIYENAIITVGKQKFDIRTGKQIN